MTDLVTVLSVNHEDNGLPRDYKIAKDHNITVIVFFGQTRGGRDHWIVVGAVVIWKNVKNVWMLVGRVISVEKLEPQNGVARFLLIVDEDVRGCLTARTKQLLMQKIGLHLTDITPGIAHASPM